MQQQNQALGLNYYSRYNRIKQPREIDSLLHLISGLNLDSLISDDLMLTISHLQQLSRERNINRRSLGKGEHTVTARLNRMSGRSSLEGRQGGYHSQREQKRGRANYIESYLSSQYSSRQSHAPDQLPEPPASRPEAPSHHDTPSHADTPSQGDQQSRELALGSQAPRQQETNIRSQWNSHMEEQFSEDMSSLIRVDQIRNASEADQEPEVQESDQGTKSEMLDRMKYSDVFQEGDPEEGNEGELPDEGDLVIEEKQEQGVAAAEASGQGIIMEKCESYYESQVQQPGQTNPQCQQQCHHGEAKHQVEQDMDPQPQIMDQDQQMPIDPSDSYQQPMVFKLPSRALTDGKYPQQVHESILTPEVQLPSTLIIKAPSSTSISERKPFKKMMLDKKLNPRLATSTILHETPVKKLNFKKVIKKQSAENRERADARERVLKIKDQKSAEQSRKLLQAFFNQN